MELSELQLQEKKWKEKEAELKQKEKVWWKNVFVKHYDPGSK